MKKHIDALRTEWRELGGLGRLAFVGVAASLLIALGLGFWIPRAAERHLLAARTETISRVVDDLARRGYVPLGPESADTLSTFDEAIRLQLLGGDTVRVKVWTPGGRIVYSDVPELIGRTFPLDIEAETALRGTTLTTFTEASEPENVYERGMGELIEFYVPVADVSDRVVGLFEVYQRSDSLRSSVASIRRNVWGSIGIGLGFLTVFMGSLTLAHARILNRRRRQAERLLRSLVEARDGERRRIVGALHDDIGQALYRLLYGLQGSQSRVDEDHPIASELARMEQLVREADSSLRSELETLSVGPIGEVGLEASLGELVETMRRESGLAIDLRYECGDLPSNVETTLFSVAKEAVINVRKHADAESVRVEVLGDTHETTLTVSDDGSGVHGARGLGLTTVHERVEALGGYLSVASRGRRGTTVRVQVPTGVSVSP